MSVAMKSLISFRYGPLNEGDALGREEVIDRLRVVHVHIRASVECLRHDPIDAHPVAHLEVGHWSSSIGSG